MDPSCNHAEHNAVEAFIDRWRDTGGTERANYQLFLTEIRNTSSPRLSSRRYSDNRAFESALIPCSYGPGYD